MRSEEKIKLYLKTEFFEVIDTIGVPHPYCITPKLVGWVHDNHYGRLGKDAIESLEKKSGPSCGMKNCNLRFDQHEQALVVRCKTKDNDLTKKYLESIVKQCEADGFAGFVLVDGTQE